MSRFALRLVAGGDSISPEEAASSFYWLPQNSRSSFVSSIGPDLHALGPVPPLNVDVVRIAVAVLAADRSTPRQSGGSNWNQRDLIVEIPVSDPQRWSVAAEQLGEVVGFLSGDRWKFEFVAEPPLDEPITETVQSPVPDRVVLLSGGADSAIGALRSRAQLRPGASHLLVSHYSNTMLAPLQREIAQKAEDLVPGPGQRHIAVRLGRRSRRIDGIRYPDEPTTRSRSLLFLSLGLAAASQHRVPLWIPENGFASINPPLGSERLGSLSTRTTHPRFLQELARVLSVVGAHAEIVNPFADLTKGEMFSLAEGQVGADAASALLSATNSCALTGQRAHGVPPGQSCGVCFGCVLRRASFVAAGITDRTDYIDPTTDDDLQNWLAGKSVEQPARNFVRRGVRAADLAAVGLPSSYPLSAALDLCRRGVAELRGLLL